MSITENGLLVKAAILHTINSPGWVYVRQLCDKTVESCINEAILAADTEEGPALARKAKAMKEGLEKLFAGIEVIRQFGTEDEPQWLSNLSFDQASEDAIQQ